MSSKSTSLKAKIRDCYNRQDNKEQNTGLQDRLVAVVREEMQESGMKLVGAILLGMGANHGTKLTVLPVSVDEKDNLPEKSEELPMGALDFLEWLSLEDVSKVMQGATYL